MNIFFLDESHSECAKAHNDKHCRKMIVEYAQLLSTAVRVLDGEEFIEYYEDKNGKQRKRRGWKINDPKRNRENVIMPRSDMHYSSTNLYKAIQPNNRFNVWVRQSDKNYQWLYKLWIELLKEYEYRFEKEHKTKGLMSSLLWAPKNIPRGGFTYPPLSNMSEECIADSVVESYRNCYMIDKGHLAQWTKRNPPEWFSGHYIGK